MVFILSQEQSITNKFQVTSFLRKEFPAIPVKLHQQFEGMESLVVISLTNGSLRDCPTILPLSLTRATSHLVIFCQDFRGILQEAVDCRLLQASTLYGGQVGPESRSADLETEAGVKEATQLLIGQADRCGMEEIESLARAWGLGELYIGQVQLGSSRHSILKGLVDKYLSEVSRMSLRHFLDSLVGRLKGSIPAQLEVNLNIVREELISKIDTGHIKATEQLELAEQLGYREHFNNLTRPTDSTTTPISDPAALIQCLNAWAEQSAKSPTSEDLFAFLTNAGLPGLVTGMRELLPRHQEDGQVVRETSVGNTAFQVFPSAIANIVTFIFAMTLCFNQLEFQATLVILLLWMPASLVFAVHLHQNQSFYRTAIGTWTALLLVLGMPLSGSVIQLRHAMKQITGEQIVQNVRMKKIQLLAKDANIANNLTSFGIGTVCLSLLNTESVVSSSRSLSPLCWITAALQLLTLVLTSTQESTSQSSLYAVIVVATTVLKISSAVVFFSADTSTLSLAAVSLPVLLLAIVINYLFEVHYVRDHSDEHNSSWLRAVNCLLHPLPARSHQTRWQSSVQMTIGLQLLMNNVIISAVAFATSLLVGIKNDLFITENLTKVVFFNSVVYSILAQILQLIFSQLSKTSSALESERYHETLNDDTDDTRPLLEDTNSSKKIKKVSWAIIPVVLLILSTAMSSCLLLFEVNTCSAHRLDERGSILCTSADLQSGTVCQLACQPTYLSPAPLAATCTWRGAWSSKFAQCRPQVALLLGEHNGKMVMEIYPQTNTTYRQLPAPPYLQGYTASYVDGAVVVCGGVALDPHVSKTCYRLEPPRPVWEESPPLLMVSFHSISECLGLGSVSVSWVVSEGVVQPSNCRLDRCAL